ncbi:hypothetical protein CDAR_595631 [Caerostris darwini]|uniref:Uncharacterized protein n=1 Tax=Caerostris darwini TaxID=1538125 RepID=A0AAV4P5D6_9ARAC|nr:hypothetical protein CDAR_595631 [Caerostris darwini]
MTTVFEHETKTKSPLSPNRNISRKSTYNPTKFCPPPPDPSKQFHPHFYWRAKRRVIASSKFHLFLERVNRVTTQPPYDHPLQNILVLKFSSPPTQPHTTWTL